MSFKPPPGPGVDHTKTTVAGKPRVCRHPRKWWRLTRDRKSIMCEACYRVIGDVELKPPGKRRGSGMWIDG